MDDINAFQNIGLTERDCASILIDAENHVGSLHDALGC
jgi:hypothetical protein